MGEKEAPSRERLLAPGSERAVRVGASAGANPPWPHSPNRSKMKGDSNYPPPPPVKASSVCQGIKAAPSFSPGGEGLLSPSVTPGSFTAAAQTSSDWLILRRHHLGEERQHGSKRSSPPECQPDGSTLNMDFLLSGSLKADFSVCAQI